MRVNRKFIYAGVFLVALGGVLVAADLGGVDTSALRDALRYWPLAIVAIGLALVLRRSQLSLSSGILAATLPGLLLGGVFAVAPRYGYECGTAGTPGTSVGSGVFDGPASVSIEAGCGALTIGTQPGSAWELIASSSAGVYPIVDDDATSLAISTAGHGDLRFLDNGRDAWKLTLPTGSALDLDLDLNATKAAIALPAAQLGSLSLRADLSEVVIDASQAAISDFSLNTDLSSLTLRLSALADVTGSIRADAASVRICAPPDLGLRISSRVSAGEVSVDGLEQTGQTWLSLNYDTATHRADIDVNASLASVEINPIGGCS